MCSVGDGYKTLPVRHISVIKHDMCASYDYDAYFEVTQTAVLKLKLIVPRLGGFMNIGIKVLLVLMLTSNHLKCSKPIPVTVSLPWNMVFTSSLFE